MSLSDCIFIPTDEDEEYTVTIHTHLNRIALLT